MELRGSSAPARTSAGHTLCLPPNPTHSEPDESSSTVPALMLMAMGMTPLSCSWRLWRGGGRGGGPFRLPSLAVEAREDPVPCSRGSLRRLLFSLMVGRHFFLRMPGDKEMGTLGCGWEALGHPREAPSRKLRVKQLGETHSPLWGWVEGPGRGPRDPSRDRASPFSRGRSSRAPPPPLSFVVVPKSPGQGTFPDPGPTSVKGRKPLSPREGRQPGQPPPQLCFPRSPRLLGFRCPPKAAALVLAHPWGYCAGVVSQLRDPAGCPSPARQGRRPPPPPLPRCLMSG